MILAESLTGLAADASCPYTAGDTNPGVGVTITYDGENNITSLTATPTDGGTITISGDPMTFADGATIICDERDLEQAIASDYGFVRGIVHREGLPRGEVLSALFASPSRAPELAERLNQDVLTLINTLAEYEVLGLVTKLPDGRYAASRDAYLSHNRG